MSGSAYKDSAFDWQRYIAVDPDILVGKPIIKGTRISVEILLERLRDGWTLDDILSAYPHLTREQVQAAVHFTNAQASG